jgi:hypothetical protein
MYSTPLSERRKHSNHWRLALIVVSPHALNKLISNAVGAPA